MFIPDKVHTLLNAAVNSTTDIQENVDKCKKIADTLQLLIAAAEVGLYYDVLDLVIKNRESILSVNFSTVRDNLNIVRSNLVKVAELVPNTTPSDPGGLE